MHAILLTGYTSFSEVIGSRLQAANRNVKERDCHISVFCFIVLYTCRNVTVTPLCTL
jgi:hypothetical protein